MFDVFVVLGNMQSYHCLDKKNTMNELVTKLCKIIARKTEHMYNNYRS